MIYLCCIVFSLLFLYCIVLVLYMVCLQIKKGSVFRTDIMNSPLGHSDNYDSILIKQINQMAMKGEAVIMGDFNMSNIK